MGPEAPGGVPEGHLHTPSHLQLPPYSFYYKGSETPDSKPSDSTDQKDTVNNGHFCLVSLSPGQEQGRQLAEAKNKGQGLQDHI